MEDTRDNCGDSEGEGTPTGDDPEGESDWEASLRQEPSDTAQGGIVQLLAEREQLLRSVYLSTRCPQKQLLTLGQRSRTIAR